MTPQRSSLFSAAIVAPAIRASFAKLDPRIQVRNPVMFVVEIGALITTGTWLLQLLGGSSLGGGDDPAWFTFTVAIWLWLTVVFANLAEALAEGRGKAQADALRAMRSDTMARLRDGTQRPAAELHRGDVVVVEAGEVIPGDGTVTEGIATVDESAITGESAPVIRESGGDRSAVTGGTRVLSDRIVVEITQEPGQSFLDRMIALVEGAERRKTPNEIALNILLVGLTIVFLVVVATLLPFARFAGSDISLTTQIALLVALIPTTIGALLSAIGIAGMDRLVRRNVLALSGRAVEASGDVDVLLLDKTGTITLGNRQAAEFVPMPGVTEAQLAEAAQLSSLADETPEGRSIVVLAKTYGIRERELGAHEARFVPFTAQTRMSGIDYNGTRLRKGAADSVIAFAEAEGGRPPAELRGVVDRIAREGGTPLAVAQDAQILGVVYLKDTVKEGMAARFDQLRAMGIRTVMVTGDNRLTAAKIAEEAGVDDFLAEATPERKMELIRAEQAEGRLVAMTGDGTNDAPALAQADVGDAEMGVVHLLRRRRARLPQELPRPDDEARRAGRQEDHRLGSQPRSHLPAGQHHPGRSESRAVRVGHRLSLVRAVERRRPDVRQRQARPRDLSEQEADLHRGLRRLVQGRRHPQLEIGRSVRPVDDQRLQRRRGRLDGLERAARRTGRPEPRRQLLLRAGSRRHEDGRADLHELVLLHRALLEVRPPGRAADRELAEQERAAFHGVRQSRRKGRGGGDEHDGPEDSYYPLARRQRGGGQQLTAFDSDARLLRCS